MRKIIAFFSLLLVACQNTEVKIPPAHVVTTNNNKQVADLSSDSIIIKYLTNPNSGPADGVFDISYFIKIKNKNGQPVLYFITLWETIKFSKNGLAANQKAYGKEPNYYILDYNYLVNKTASSFCIINYAVEHNLLKRLANKYGSYRCYQLTPTSYGLFALDTAIEKPPMFGFLIWSRKDKSRFNDEDVVGKFVMRNKQLLQNIIKQ